ncbi:MAG: hypothetical protein ACLGH3_06770 [Actinomycetota bacterium]
MFSKVAFLSVLGLLAACAPSQTTDPAVPVPATLHARGLLLAPGEAIRLAVDAGTRGIEVRPAFKPTSARLMACPLMDISQSLPAASGCKRDINQGVRTPLAGSIHAFRIESDEPIELDLLVEYFGEGQVEVWYPRTPASPSVEACLDHGCDAFFERLPVADGRLHVEASFEGGIGNLLVEQGRVLARSQTATGVPYRVAAQERGDAPLSVNAGLTAGAEYAVSLGQIPGPSAAGLSDIRLKMTWPT